MNEYLKDRGIPCLIYNKAELLVSARNACSNTGVVDFINEDDGHEIKKGTGTAIVEGHQDWSAGRHFKCTAAY